MADDEKRHALDDWPIDDLTPEPVLIHEGMSKEEADRVLLEAELTRVRGREAMLLAEINELKDKLRRASVTIARLAKGQTAP